MTKSTGMIRRVDELGRIVIPIEMRKVMDINERDSLEIYTDECNRIILKKYIPGCIFCGNAEDLIQVKGNKICTTCQKDIIESGIIPFPQG